MVDTKLGNACISDADQRGEDEEGGEHQPLGLRSPRQECATSGAGARSAAGRRPAGAVIGRSRPAVRGSL